MTEHGKGLGRAKKLTVVYHKGKKVYHKSSFKPWGLINFMVHNHPGSNRERGQIETINLSSLFIWMGKLTRFNSRPGLYSENTVYHCLQSCSCQINSVPSSSIVP